MFKSSIFALGLVATSVVAQEAPVQPPFNCINNAPALLGSCGAELEFSGQVLPLNEARSASSEQLAALMEAWSESDLPTAACCQTIKQFVDAACICDPQLRELLPSVGVNVEPIESVLTAAGEKCGTFEFTACP